MYNLASQNPNNSDLVMAYNQAYMDYMYPQSDPLMEALGGGGGQFDARQFSTPTLESYAGGNTVTEDQLAQYRQLFGLGSDWAPEGISIEVPDDTSAQPGNAFNFGGLARTALSGIAEPIAWGANVAGNLSAGRNLGESIDQGTRDWQKDFQSNNLMGNIGRAVAGEENTKKMYEMPLGQQADQFKQSVNDGRIPGIYHILKANEEMNNMMGNANPSWGQTYNNIWGGMGSDRKWDYRSQPREGMTF
jgi:hypothetical protein